MERSDFPELTDNQFRDLIRRHTKLLAEQLLEVQFLLIANRGNPHVQSPDFVGQLENRENMLKEALSRARTQLAVWLADNDPGRR